MKLIRLSTGEEIIAKIYDQSDFIVVENAIILLPAGEGKLGMASFIPYADGSSITINKQHVMFMTNPSEDLYRQVLQITTGIATPSTGIIT